MWNYFVLTYLDTYLSCLPFFLWWFSHSVVSDSCDPMDCSPPVSSVHGILQARILEWVAISFSTGSSQPKDWTWVSCIGGRFFTVWATREALEFRTCPQKQGLSPECPPVNAKWSVLLGKTEKNNKMSGFGGGVGQGILSQSQAEKMFLLL